MATVAVKETTSSRSLPCRSASSRRKQRSTLRSRCWNVAIETAASCCFADLEGAGCGKCHSLDQAKNGFGPNLSSIGLRSNARHIVQSIVEPSAVITEGFNQLTVVTDEGKVFSGVLLEESGLTLSLGQSSGERVDIPKDSIEERKTSPEVRHA